MFVANMSLVDQIEAYFEKEKNRDTPSTNTTTTATTATTTSTTTTTTTTTNNNNNNNNNNNSVEEANKNTNTSTNSDPDPDPSAPASKNPDPGATPGKTPANGRVLKDYAGATFDAELRKFYVDIIYARIEQIWQHPGVYDLPEEPSEEDDHMGLLFDKHAHFCKKLKTPNHILKQIYDDAVTAMFGYDSDSDDEEGMGPMLSLSDTDSDGDGFTCCPHHHALFGFHSLPDLHDLSSDDEGDDLSFLF